MSILRNRFGDLIKVLVDTAVAFNLAEVFIQVSPLKIEEFVVDQGLDLDASVQVYGILCADLHICGFGGCLKGPNCHEVSTGKVLILYDVEQQADFKILAKGYFNRVTMASFTQDIHFYFYLFYLLDLNEILNRSGFFKHDHDGLIKRPN